MVRPQTVLNIPKWLSQRLKPADLSEIAAAIRQVEVTTSGEIVVMVVRRSILTGHIVPVLIGFLAFAYGTLGEFIFRMFSPQGYFLYEYGWFLIPLLAFLFAPLAWVQRVSTPPHDAHVQVLRRAEAEFLRAGFHLTTDSTGILIFVSIVERRAVVLADKGIAQHLPTDIWNEVVDLIIQNIRRGNFAEGLVSAVKRCGEILAPHFPIKNLDRNELPDAIVIKD